MILAIRLLDTRTIIPSELFESLHHDHIGRRLYISDDRDDEGWASYH